MRVKVAYRASSRRCFALRFSATPAHSALIEIFGGTGIPAYRLQVGCTGIE
jgi:hypothetical protein